MSHAKCYSCKEIEAATVPLGCHRWIKISGDNHKGSICLTCLKDKDEPHFSCRFCKTVVCYDKFEGCCGSDLCPDCLMDEGYLHSKCSMCDKIYCDHCDPDNTIVKKLTLCSKCSEEHERVLRKIVKFTDNP